MYFKKSVINFITVTLEHDWASLWYYNHYSGGAVSASVVVSFCFARCPFAVTQKLDFLDL